MDSDRLLSSLLASGHTTDIIEPFTGAILYSLPTSTEDDIDAVFDEARRAQKMWADTPVSVRSAIMLRFHDALLVERQAVLDLVQRETGKARKDANEEVLDVCIIARHYARDARRLLRPRRRLGALPGLVGVVERRVPFGVVGVIAPWNYPLTLAISDAIPAMMAGNCVVVKPDVQTTLSAMWIADLLERAGLPPGVFTVVAGEGSVVGPLVIDRSDYVMFTGSTAVGKLLMAQAAQTVTRVSLELGGHAPLLVFDDADVDVAVAGALASKFRNAGQTCVCANRILVQEGIYDAFSTKLADAVAAMRVGAGTEAGVAIGPLIDGRAVDKSEAHVTDALEKGATLLAGGKRLPEVGANFFAPTVLGDATVDMRIFREETFGPVAPLFKFKDEAEAVAMANDTPYGLAAYFFTRDLGRAWRVSEGVDYGLVGCNEGIMATEVAPFGGMKESGLGREGSKYGVDEFIEAKYVLMGGIGAP